MNNQNTITKRIISLTKSYQKKGCFTVQSGNVRPFYISLVLLLFFFLFHPNLSHAQTAETASLEVHLPKEAVGMEMTLYPVADWQGGQDFRLHSDFQDSGLGETINLQEISDLPHTAETLSLLAKANHTDGQTGTVDADGTLLFENLDAACYLLEQTGRHNLDVQKVLIQIPYETDGALSYHLVSNPKYQTVDGAVILTIMDKKNNRIPHATFKLQKKVYITENVVVPSDVQTGKDTDGRFYWEDYEYDLISNENGQISVSNLPIGMYRLVVTTIPSQYILNQTIQYFSIEGSGRVDTVDGEYKPSGQVPELVIIVDKPSETDTDESSETESNTQDSETPETSRPAGETDETEQSTEVPSASSADTDNDSKNNGADTGDSLAFLPHLFVLCLSTLLAGGWMKKRMFGVTAVKKRQNGDFNDR